MPALEYTCYEYFRDIRSKVESFVEYLLCHQNFFGMDYPPHTPILDLFPCYVLLAR